MSVPVPVQKATKRLWPFLIVVAGSIVACLTLYRAVPTQPVYQGKPLTYWLDWLPATVDTGNGHARLWPEAVPTDPAQQQAFLDRLNDLSAKARIALDKSGTNGMPLLLKRLQARESGGDRMIQRLKNWMKLRWPESKEVRRWKAVTALMELRDSFDLSPIVPQLIQMSQSSDPQVKKAALFLLRYVKPKAAAQPQKTDQVAKETHQPG